MIVYRACLGDPAIIDEYDRGKRKGTQDKPVRRPPARGLDKLDIYDSVLGESKANGGDRLQFREFILYERARAYPEYVVAFNRIPPELQAWDKLKTRAKRALTTALDSISKTNEKAQSAEFKEV